MGIYVDAVYGNIAQHNGTTLFLSQVLYTIQIYADFAGYSLMAIGCGKLLGIELQTNFIRPYLSKTVTEFWRRWHISLTTWFRDYIYFPLGGNRVKKMRWIMNIMIVFIISGLWHGAAYTFLIWGALHGICMILERLLYRDKMKQISDRITFPNVIRIFITFNIVSLAWIFFRTANISDAFEIIGKIFTSTGKIFLDADSMVYGFAFVALLFLKDFMDEFFPGKVLLFNNKHLVVRWISYVAVVCLILLFGVLDGGSFIYFQF
ncbi:MAG: MBOAT family protein [Eubacteriales bacterium]|nr:MBOAT family protein [Eubacteriales bacterium]